MRAARRAPLRLVALAAVASFAGLAPRPAAQEPATPTAPAAAGTPETRTPAAGPWRAWLDSPGGELPFELELSRDAVLAGGAWHAEIGNGLEDIVVPVVSWDGRQLVLEIDNYAARVVAACTPDERTLEGSWSCDLGPRGVSTLPFHAVAGEAARFPALGGDEDDVEGRWAVKFASEEELMVGLLQRGRTGAVHGTILSTTGDYRFLAGDARGGRLLLSCFDGAHAYLLDARRQQDGSLAGDFWSGDKGHDTLTLRRDEQVTLPDGFTITRARAGANVNALTFPDLDGRARSLGEAALGGKARIIEIFGSWCPNCHDETVDLLELQEKYGRAGLSIVGLAFERSGDPARDVAQVRKYALRHGVTWPLLLAGVADRLKAAEALGVLESVHAFPTTLFVRADGSIRAVHTGYSGPATSDAHAQLLRQFTEQIEALLAEGSP
jgi:thiol-disulfide isomerase/thioredoxin